MHYKVAAGPFHSIPDPAIPYFQAKKQGQMPVRATGNELFGIAMQMRKLH